MPGFEVLNEIRRLASRFRAIDSGLGDFRHKNEGQPTDGVFRAETTEGSDQL